MVNFNKLPEWMRRDLEEREVSPERVARMDPQDVLEEYLAWNGIIGWGSQIYSAVHAIDEAVKVTEAYQDHPRRRHGRDA